MRVIRGVRDALLDYQGWNPVSKMGKFKKDGSINNKHEIGYRLDDKGIIQCPDNLLRPKITETRKLDGKVIKYKGVKNPNYSPVNVPYLRVNSDFSKCFPLSKKTREGGKKTQDKPKVLNADQMAQKLTKAIIKMQPLEVSETRANILKALETALYKFFEIRSGQERAEQQEDINTNIEEAKTGTDNQ